MLKLKLKCRLFLGVFDADGPDGELALGLREGGGVVDLADAVLTTALAETQTGVKWERSGRRECVSGQSWICMRKGKGGECVRDDGISEACAMLFYLNGQVSLFVF